MHQGNWTCSVCEGEIKELPFEPRSTEGLKCRECHAKERDSKPTAPNNSAKPMFSGNWTCAGCGSAITKLPFEPRSTANLKCIECFKQSR